MARVAVCQFHWGGGRPEQRASARSRTVTSEHSMPTTPMPLTIPPRPCTRFAKHCPDVVAVVIVRILVVPPRCAHPANCRPATPPPPSCSELCSRRHHTMHSSSEASSTAMMSKRSKEGGWSSIGEIRSKKRWMCVRKYTSRVGTIFFSSVITLSMRQKWPRRPPRWPSKPQC